MLFAEALQDELIAGIRSYLQQQKVLGRTGSARGSRPEQAGLRRCDRWGDHHANQIVPDTISIVPDTIFTLRAYIHTSIFRT